MKASRGSMSIAGPRELLSCKGRLAGVSGGSKSRRAKAGKLRLSDGNPPKEKSRPASGASLIRNSQNQAAKPYRPEEKEARIVSPSPRRLSVQSSDRRHGNAPLATGRPVRWRVLAVEGASRGAAVWSSEKVLCGPEVIVD
ncbi:hypothetical protein HYQ46_003556 [Verticillium longisporum]|nr:hypothetical protein HYQ46_003556 [Verticillium longisporum]